jgi:bifunctional non-homologous end joining protein LigD
MALEEYRRKRDFRKTSEPVGAPPRRDEAATEPAFVVQKHRARRLHYDFRLELDDVLKSWAVPKGPSLDPAEKRLAVEVEDHPLEYGGFEGVIPEGEYGGGTVMLWDRGTWAPADPDPAGALRNGALKFVLNGEKLRGNWMLVRLHGRKKADERQRNWLLVKERDAAAVPGSGGAVTADLPFSVASGRSLDGIAADRDRVWHSDPQGTTAYPVAASPSPKKGRRGPPVPAAREGSMPEALKPQLAVLARQAPDGSQWLHEIKYDGYRLLARIARGEVRLETRSGLDWTAKFPELARHFGGLPVETALIDGEVVDLAADGTTSFSGLQDALSSGATGRLRFFAFDLVYRDGWDLTEAALEDRKAALAQIVPREGLGALRYSDHQVGQGPAVLRHACKLGLEGIVSKRRDSPYHAGRDASWRKVKCANRDEFLIVGFTDPEGGRVGFGALLLGCYDPSRRLRYAGRVGTGFSVERLEALRRRLDALARRSPTVPLPKDAPHKDVHWVKPSLVAEIRFAGWTADGMLRHAAFLGLREDKDAREVAHDPKVRLVVSPDEPASASPARRDRARDGSLEFAGVRFTHPDRVLLSDPAVSKLELAQYYAAVAAWALPQLAHRPLTLVRGPGGAGKKSFYQKHLGPGAPAALKRFEIAGEDRVKFAPVVEDMAGLVALVQMDVLEIHPWGAAIDDIEKPDRVTFDLDPDAGLPWSRVIEAAQAVREALGGIGLESFVKTTGGKGLHVVVPLVSRLGWETVKTFSRWVAERLADLTPEQFTANQALRARRGRIYIDYLRNGRGATAVGAYSPRARPGAPVSTPLSWREVAEGVRPEAFTVATMPARMRALGADPWGGIGALHQSLGPAVRRHIGI